VVDTAAFEYRVPSEKLQRVKMLICVVVSGDVSRPVGDARAVRSSRESAIRSCSLPIVEDAAERVLRVDASDTGWGAVCGDQSVAGALPNEVLGSSSTLRELVGLRLALSAWSANRRVEVLCWA